MKTKPLQHPRETPFSPKKQPGLLTPLPPPPPLPPVWSALEPGEKGVPEETFIWTWFLVLHARLWQHLIFNSNLPYYFKKLSHRALTHQIGSHGATFQVKTQFYCETKKAAESAR